MKDREELIAFHRNYCIHYDPRGSKCSCDAGVELKPEQKVVTDKPPIRWGPCIGGHVLEDVKAHCPHWARPSREKGEAYADRVEATLQRLVIVDPVISAWRKKHPMGKVEVIECPACKCRLHLSQDAYNGHVRAKCETEGCVCFIE